MNFERMEYPRPQMRRDKWAPLNGEWEFAFDDADAGDALGYPSGDLSFGRKINVPFCYQTPASGIGDECDHPAVWYRRTFAYGGEGRVLLNFNGCDYETDVWVNGCHAISHRGAYTPFRADVTRFLKEQNVLVVRCRDLPEEGQPRGKQSWTGKPFSCWYTPSTGIWQSVWLEFFGEDCVDELSIFPDYDGFAVCGELSALRGAADEATISLSFGGRTLKTERVALSGRRASFRIPLGAFDPALVWSPEHPALIEADVALFANGRETDRVHTRTGMRKISVDGEGNLLLNGEKLFQRLVLDQGYWRESGLTPPSAEAIRKDIESAIAMGFNGARKHQKIEDPYYYYYAEELGFLTWCEMPSAYAFHADEMMAIAREWQEIVFRMRNFTSNLCYVPFNESWGVQSVLSDGTQQDFVRAIYRLTRAMDPTRPVSANDGWECLDQTDIIGIHDYSESGSEFPEKYEPAGLSELWPQGRKLMASGCEYRGQPLILSEFGGIALSEDTEGGAWGYGEGAHSCEEFYSRFERLLAGIRGCAFQGYCYTQLTDVQQEVNGLLYDDRTPKFEFSRLRALNERFGRRDG